jgi:carboxymethylenebutenolidase
VAALTEGPFAAKTERIELDVDGTRVDAIHARPDGTPLGGLVLAPDIGGLRPLFDDIARRIATHGLSVCAVEPFSRVPATERAELDLDARMARAATLYDDTQLADLAEAADHLEAADHVHSTAVLGFCMGGYYTLKAAASGRFERAVAFYGMVRTPERWSGPGHHAPLDTAESACPTLAIFGDRDPFVPEDDIESLRTAWKGKPECKVVVYRGAEHGFVHDPDRPAHRAEDAADAWRRALAFLLD